MIFLGQVHDVRIKPDPKDLHHHRHQTEPPPPQPDAAIRHVNGPGKHECFNVYDVERVLRNLCVHAGGERGDRLVSGQSKIKE